MKIKIIKSNGNNWYNDYIGETFELAETPYTTTISNQKYYKIEIITYNNSTPNRTGISYMNWVFKKDAILLNRKEKLERILNDTES